ncbi:exonuclease III [Pseudovibrio axinellae]|uniref:Exonuclease III n=1 Tax=Pseudovibrio axinellae TaxID=989403 RepID=A0A166AV90_9HYPH|nr:endonuclease/exonuclease/phosphatase family protein [Pseudovibrio axinellae]KZL21595.1 exonuclease III [Pseudovibrio axinellae]SER10989.1 Uncharacterized conserved protein YafD, endonuclease/exonuclease/phosphatase (EEP) superfamily [Pseudovibrio axinellae]
MVSLKAFFERERNASSLLRLSRVASFTITALLLLTFLTPGNLLSEASAFFIPQLLAAGFAGLLLWITSERAFHWAQLLCFIGLSISSYWMVASIQQVTQSIPISGTPTDAPQLKVMSLNLLHMRFEEKSIQQLIEKRQPDLISFQETASATPRLKSFLVEHYQYSVLPPENQTTDITLFSKYPLANAGLIFVPDLKEGPHIPKEFLSAEVDVNGSPIQLYAVHPASPRGPNRLEGRSKYFDFLSKHIKAQKTQVPIVILGDWNTPIWSKTFQDLLSDLQLKTTLTSFIPQTTRYFQIHP